VKIEDEKIIKNCKYHGNLYIGDIIKKGTNSKGIQTYRCKKCMHILHKNHYENNKDKVKKAHKEYREKDPQKYREICNKSKRKMYSLDKEKYQKRQLDWDKNNPDMKSKRQKRYKDKAVKELNDIYVKQHLVAGTGLKHADIPQELVELKRTMMLLKRNIKDKLKKKEHLNYGGN
jgi:hypothetical protein